MASLKITHAGGEVVDYPLSTATTITITDELGGEKYSFSVEGVSDIAYSTEDVAAADAQAAKDAAAVADQAAKDAAAESEALQAQADAGAAAAAAAAEEAAEVPPVEPPVTPA